jgi:hypothetical protein
MSYSHSSQDLHIVPVFTPVDTTNVTASSEPIDAGECQHVQFLLYFGQIDVVGVVDVYEADDYVPTNSVATAKFSYRLSAATGTDLMGATAAGSLALATAADIDGKIMVIDVNPADLTAGYPYVWVSWNPTAGANNLLAIIALVTPRYSQDIVSSKVD